jgi:catalase
MIDMAKSPDASRAAAKAGAKPAAASRSKAAVPQAEMVGSGGETHQSAAAADQRITTNHGVPVSDNQNTLSAGPRGPHLLEDFVLREKIQHFDHERIPERIVHARGSAAHGFFEC